MCGQCKCTELSELDKGQPVVQAFEYFCDSRYHKSFTHIGGNTLTPMLAMIKIKAIQFAIALFVKLILSRHYQLCSQSNHCPLCISVLCHILCVISCIVFVVGRVRAMR